MNGLFSAGSVSPPRPGPSSPGAIHWHSRPQRGPGPAGCAPGEHSRLGTSEQSGATLSPPTAAGGGQGTPAARRTGQSLLSVTPPRCPDQWAILTVTPPGCPDQWAILTMPHPAKPRTSSPHREDWTRETKQRKGGGGSEHTANFSKAFPPPSHYSDQALASDAPSPAHLW